jgi:hypothetical protein
MITNRRHWVGQRQQFVAGRIRKSAKDSFKMAPLVLFGTLITRFGGSAGRRRNSCAMGGTIADQFVFKLDAGKKTISFLASVLVLQLRFGTPLAGFVRIRNTFFKISFRVFLYLFDRLYCLFHS